ncbi:MAG: hypothetical protein JO053_09930 [Acidobacteria bacterium]|nr:hypothetical protein [Acidobacteriota bacterium]
MGQEITSTNPVVKAVIEGSAPRAAQLAAARGMLPLPQADLLELLVALNSGGDDELSSIANETLRSQPTDGLEAAVRAGEMAPPVLSYFVGRDDIPKGAHEAILVNPATPVSAIASFASTTTNGSLLELVSINQQLLIQNPELLDAILTNPARTAEAERRALEIRREFFEKERGAQQIANELRARGNEAAAEFFEQAEIGAGSDSLSMEDALLLAEHIEVPDLETDDSWLGLEYIEEIYEETEEQRHASIGKIIGELQQEGEDISGERISMINRVMRMGVKDRVRLGMKGDREARNILIRDPNKLVASAVANNPRITEQEVEMIASMRSISEDILRQIATNRQWSRSYNVMHSLARNPRTPIANSMTIMSRLQMRDLISLSKNRNVSDAVRRHADRLVRSRTGGRN